MPARRLLVAAFAIACQGAMAQTTIAPTVPVSVSVQRLAPQLIAFAGSDANFQNLVNGLANGTPVQLTTTLANGFTQTVTFTPAAISSPTQIAQVLEAARQQLIGLGVGVPTAEQIGFTLMGGFVPTASGGAQVSGLTVPTASANSASRATQIQQQASAGASGPAPSANAAAGSTTPVTSSVSVQTTPTAPVSTSTVAVPRQTGDTPIAAGATSRSGTSFTSVSPATQTSASPPVNTSTSLAPTTPNQAPGAGSAPPAAATRLSR